MFYTGILIETRNLLLKDDTFSLKDIPLWPSFLNNSSYLAPESFTTLLWSVVAAVPCMLCFICSAGDRSARRSPTKRRTSNGSFSRTLNSECLLVCTQEENEDSRQRWGTTTRSSHSSCPVISQRDIREPAVVPRITAVKLHLNCMTYYINSFNTVVHNKSSYTFCIILKAECNLSNWKEARKQQKEVLILRNALWYYRVPTKPAFCEAFTSLKLTCNNHRANFFLKSANIVTFFCDCK